MHQILILGAGEIGSLISVLLASSKSYQVFLADINIHTPVLKKLAAKFSHLKLVKLDASRQTEVTHFIKQKKIEVLISALPYYCNIEIAKLAHKNKVHYFDLTEDTKTADLVAKLSKKSSTVFVPQCGLAPGFINIVANDLMKSFSKLDTVKMRVGALPLNASNALQYSLTWSPDGLINEYGNPCLAIQNSKAVQLPPLDDLEKIELDGMIYEAFNTSGGAGSLVKTYAKKVKHLTYKTIRYPGHCEKMRFLMQDLKLNEDRDTLKRILKNALPKTLQDVVLVYASVTGTRDKQYCEESYVKKFYAKKLHGFNWSAIQLTTASSLCTVLDIILTHPKKYHGLIRQEQFSLEEFTNNRFGKYYG